MKKNTAIATSTYLLSSPMPKTAITSGKIGDLRYRIKRGDDWAEHRPRHRREAHERANERPGTAPSRSPMNTRVSESPRWRGSSPLSSKAAERAEDHARRWHDARVEQLRRTISSQSTRIRNGLATLSAFSILARRRSAWPMSGAGGTCDQGVINGARVRDHCSRALPPECARRSAPRARRTHGLLGARTPCVAAERKCARRPPRARASRRARPPGRKGTPPRRSSG